jgi:hypothetical protein
MLKVKRPSRREARVTIAAICPRDEIDPKVQSRDGLVLTPQPSESAIAAHAYELWQARGCPDGSPEEDWFRAERELQHPQE